MRTTPAALLAHMAGGTTTLAHLIKITRADGEILAVTDHDQDITYPLGSPAGQLYKASLGMDASAIETTATLSVDNLEARGFLDVLGVSEASIAAGVWDYADVRVYRVNWADLSMGDEKLIRGWIGDISVARGEFKNEIRSVSQKLQSRIGEIVAENCKADLFDTRCKVVATEGLWKFSGVAVSTIVAAQRQFTCAALTQTVPFFEAGKVVWETGQNAGLAKEIKTHASGGDIALQEPMPYEIEIGDTGVFYAGCTKRYTEDCLGKFANTDNFRGFPFLPGIDAILRGPR
jgi:uncharacterized phage protein (TIGR02218 family)